MTRKPKFEVSLAKDENGVNSITITAFKEFGNINEVVDWLHSCAEHLRSSAANAKHGVDL